MKFGITYEELKKNPLFAKYLPEGQFLNYKQLKTLIKEIKKNTDCSEEKKTEFVKTLEAFVTTTDNYIKQILDERASNSEQIKHITTYKALEEYATINQEAVRKISKKFDKKLQVAPFLQQQMLDQMNNMEIGSKRRTKGAILKAELEEQELYDKESFNLLKQDVQLLQGYSDKNLKNKIQSTESKQFTISAGNIVSEIPLRRVSEVKLQPVDDQINKVEEIEHPDGPKQKLTLKQWLKKHRQLIELAVCYITIMCLPIFFAPFVKESTSNIKTVLVFALPLSFFLGASLGGNDICNSVGTTFGSKTLTLGQCIALGIFFEVLGALTLGGNVSSTISKKIIDPTSYLDDPLLYAVSMTSVLAGAAFCVCSVTVYGIPVSITKAVIFGLTSAGLASMGGDGISMSGLSKVLISLITSPVVGGLISMTLYVFIIYVVKKKENSYSAALNWLPFLGFFNVSTLTFVTLYKGLKMDTIISIIAAAIAATVVAIVLFVFTHIKRKSVKGLELNDQEKVDLTSKLFKPLLLISASAGAFAHGANNVGNSVGPLVGVLGIYNDGEDFLGTDFETPLWVLILGAASFACGILLVGSRTIKTMGKGITELDPMKSFAIEIGSASAILIASLLGIPVSTSHVSVGCVIGGTLAEKIGGYPFVIKKKALTKMVSSWFYTIPFVYFFVVYFFYSFKGVFY